MPSKLGELVEVVAENLDARDVVGSIEFLVLRESCVNSVSIELNTYLAVSAVVTASHWKKNHVLSGLLKRFEHQYIWAIDRPPQRSGQLGSSHPRESDQAPHRRQP